MEFIIYKLNQVVRAAADPYLSFIYRVGSDRASLEILADSEADALALLNKQLAVQDGKIVFPNDVPWEGQ